MPVAAAEGDRPRGLSTATLSRLVLAAPLALLALAYLIAEPLAGGSFTYTGDEAPPFEIAWTELEEVDPGDGELLRLERSEDGRLEQSLAIRSLREPPLPLSFSRAPSLEALALASDLARESIAVRHPGARVTMEGLGRLEIRGGTEAYQLAFVAPAPAGGMLIGKWLLVPEDPDAPLFSGDDGSPRAVTIEVVERTEDPNVIERLEEAPATVLFNWPSQINLEDEAAIQTERGLEEALRSFAFL